ncbi:MAG: hypothetical protein V4644_02060 [Patescibacteria group bacterium]
MQSDGVFFISVLAFFFILWFATGGPTKPISFAGPFITPITDVDTVQSGYGTIDVDQSGTWTGDGSFWSGLMGGGTGSAALDASELRAFGEASPFRGLVTVSSASAANAEDADEEYVTLRASGDQQIDITGWRLVSGASGKSASIPVGAALPRGGRVSDTGRIILAPGEEAIVTTGESPKGVSFKENLCTGYFAETQSFNPQLPNRCPSAEAEFDRFYSGNALRDDRCYERMRSAQSCETPDDDDVTRACEQLIEERLTYDGCVATHRTDAGFSGDTWRIYLERESELWKPSRDAVKLVDGNGKTVDLYTY